MCVCVCSVCACVRACMRGCARAHKCIIVCTPQARLLKEICHFTQSVKSKEMYQVG